MGQGTEQDLSGLGVGLLVVIAVLSVAAFVLWVAAIVSVARDPRLTGGGKLLWIAVVLGFPFLGSIGWFAGGRRAQLVRGPAAHQAFG
ncbi:PLD nuclease N-terminal domain-containing protein [Umezawaea endophytica]|uniref:PLD nuclease N-terminal domain-containing protein n=1 Tax=Umezawaea endophytica TaxID=1654476 RepID=A0A9X2VGA0_9PSEU|nr:PLD nuclease N-terminal domain-containing protein [Umezawaea endophytica]MCS7475902.1 PLD nuclease N-terminal domain-containing protein [Umezawaea endophytica]